MSDMTRAGWPRPIVGGWPVPWVSPASDLGVMNSDRVARTRTGRVCGVCGGALRKHARAIVLVAEAAVPADDSTIVRAMDDTAMHERCAWLAWGRCPALERLRAQGRLLALSVPPHAALPPDTVGEQQHLHYRLRDCLPWSPGR